MNLYQVLGIQMILLVKYICVTHVFLSSGIDTVHVYYNDMNTCVVS